MRSASLDGYLRSTEAVSGEVDVELRVAEGEVPEGLRGVLYRNGPGKNEVFGVKYDHPFDGDGMITRFTFEDGRVRYKNRFVRTEEYVAEERAGRMLYRSFGTNLPGGLRRNALRLRFKNAANTSVVLHAGKLLALWEGGLPHALDPETLETHGRYDYDGRLANRTSLVGRLLAPELPFSAHPKRDVATGDLVNFGTLMGPQNQVVSYRVTPDGKMAPPTFTRLDKLSFVHDFVLTKSYSVYFLSSVSFGIAATLLGFTTPVSSLAGAAGPSTILLVPRDGGEPIRVRTAGGFLFHFANGFEDAEGCVVVDGMRTDALAPAAAVNKLLRGGEVKLPPTHPTRYLIDPRTRRVTETRLSESPAELPTIDPRCAGRSYRHFWAIAGAPDQDDPFFHRVLHFDHEGSGAVRDFGRDFPGEPLFVPAPGATSEGEGWVLTLVYREAEHRSDLYVLRPDNLETVCRLELPHHIPPGFHGTWAPA